MKKIIQKIGTSENPALKLVAGFLRYPLRSAQFWILNLHKEEHDIVNLIKAILEDGDSLMWPTEMMQMYHCISSVKGRDGDFAEVGVFAGRSAKLICETKGDRNLHLFDTFQGLPKPESTDDNYILHEKMFVTKSAKIDSVKAYLHNFKNVFFYQGVFPETAKFVTNKFFAFVHIDVDLYRSTVECLEFFYPRMVNGGIILSHDYSSLIGVRRAFDEFFADKDESIVELSTNQCMIVKNFTQKKKLLSL